MTTQVMTCQECDLDFMPTQDSVNGPVIFRCQTCSMLVRDKLALRHHKLQRWDKYWKLAGYVVGILFVAYIFLWPLFE